MIVTLEDCDWIGSTFKGSIIELNSAVEVLNTDNLKL